MKLKFNREEMAETLTAICAVASSRTPKDSLKCVRIEAQSDVLWLSATDLELSLRCAVTQVEVGSTGDVLVVADTFARIVRECNDELMAFEVKDNIAHVQGQGSHFKILTQDTADFPAVPQMEGTPQMTIEHATLSRLIELTTFAAARESTRYAINGVLWDIEGENLTMAATDGRRLAVGKGKLTVGKGKNESQAIVPTKTLSLLARLAAEADTQVGLQIEGNRILLTTGRATISSSLVEGQFPKYQDVIPSDCDQVAQLDAAEFLSALKRAALLTNEESKGVRFAFSKGSLTLSSRAPEQGEATISVPIDYDGAEIEIGFNPVFIVDMLRIAHAEKITLAIKEPNRPGLMNVGDDFVYVVMPVNLTSA